MRTPALSKVVALMSMPLDGYVADFDDGVAAVVDGSLPALATAVSIVC